MHWWSFLLRARTQWGPVSADGPARVRVTTERHAEQMTPARSQCTCSSHSRGSLGPAFSCRRSAASSSPVPPLPDASSTSCSP